MRKRPTPPFVPRSRGERRDDAPRRVRNGVKPRHDDERIAAHWIAHAWLELIERWLGLAAASAGVEYARQGQVVSLDLEPGRAAARVQGRAARAYATTLSVETFTEAQWERIVGAMSGEAIHGARLLAGDVPEQLGALLAGLDLPLVPRRTEALGSTCACAAPQPCKHVGAIAWLVADRMVAEPLVTLLLRGQAAERVLDHLQRARTIHSRGTVAAHVAPALPELREDAGLTESTDRFWHPGPALAELERIPPASHLPHALLRRLGPSPLPGRFPMVGLLASIYDTVAGEAIALRDRAEGLDGAAGEPSAND